VLHRCEEVGGFHLLEEHLRVADHVEWVDSDDLEPREESVHVRGDELL
jgi:hypothetical protein